MILGASARMLRQTHVVAPLATSESQFVSKVRVSVAVNDDAQSVYMVWPFPNAESQHSRWEYRVNSKGPSSLDLDALLASVGFQHEGSPVLAMPIVGVVASFQELVLDGAWEDMADGVNVDLEYLNESYGTDHGFVMAKLPGSGTFELEWRWFGDAPFVHGRARTAQHTDTLIAAVVNHTRLLWVRPSGSDARGPGRQRTAQDQPRLKSLAAPGMAPITRVVAAKLLPERRRNDDVTAEACQQHAGQADDHYTCAVS